VTAVNGHPKFPTRWLIDGCGFLGPDQSCLELITEVVEVAPDIDGNRVVQHQIEEALALPRSPRTSPQKPKLWF
jgi:hypothetical protein